MKSPMQKSLKYLRERDWHCAIVEKWNPHAGIRQDLFGCVDILAVKDGMTMGVQTTTVSNMAARLKKLLAQPMTRALSEAWRIEVHGWRKDGTVRIRGWGPLGVQ